MQAFLSYLHSPKKDWPRQILRAFLFVLSLFFRLGVYIKNELYDNCNSLGKGFQSKLFKIHIYNFNAKTISIGNIVAGGTGKTPLTILIAKEILKRKKRLAILSRGYKSKMETEAIGSHLICEGNGPLKKPDECGDEPYLISKSVPEAFFYVGKNRIESSKMALVKGAQVLLLDDGMQYRKLHKDVEIVVLDGKDPFGKEYFLPRGFLRDHPKSLRRADLIVVNHIEDEAKLNQLKTNLKKWTNAPIVGANPKYIGTSSLDNLSAFELKGKKVAAFCGIAKPKYFYNLLEKEGAIVLLKKDLTDHEKMDEKAFDSFSKKACDLGANLIVCTEKDAVKLGEIKEKSLSIGYVKIELVIEYGYENFEKTIDKIF